MKFLQKKLNEWLENGIINLDTYNAILDYEKNLSLKNKNLFLSSLFIIAYVSIGIGILSMIAANWEEIPTLIKFFVILSFHVFIAFLILKFENKINLKEGLLLLFQFLFLGEIALTTQVFHLEGKWQYALFFWGFLMIFPTTLTNFTFSPLLNIFVLHLSITLILLDFTKWKELHPIIFYIFFSYIMILVLFEILTKIFKKENFKNASNIYTIAFYFISLLWLQIQWYINFKDLGSNLFLFLNLLLIFISFFLFFINYKIMFINDKTLLLSFISVFLLIIVNYSLGSSHIFKLELTKKILGTLLFLVLMILSSYIVLKFRILWLFHFFVFMILLRIWTIYIEIFKNLTYTGIGLSFFGLFILISIFFYKKIIKNILQKELSS